MTVTAPALVPVVNSLGQLRRLLNPILSRLQSLEPTYGDELPATEGATDGALFVLTTSQTLYQLQAGSWVAVDGTP